MLARLKPGVTLEQAQAEIAVLYQALQQESAARRNHAKVASEDGDVEPAGAGWRGCAISMANRWCC